MKKYSTEIMAICPIDGELKPYAGPYVPGISFADAQEYCFNNGLGYCKVIGELVSIIPCKDGTCDPDWNNRTDFDLPQLN